MNNEFEIQKLIGYVTGNCPQEDVASVIEWIESSDENRALYENYKLIWDSANVKKQSLLIDVDSKWDDFKNRVAFESTTSENKTSILKVLIRISRVAAVIAVLLSVWIFSNKNEEQVPMVNQVAQALDVETPLLLPDGTEVIMNKGAEITYPEYFKGDVRKIDFRGEAFFNVAHNPEKPMTIATGDIRVKILGTSFNLCNCENSNEITLFLETGKVLFYSVDPVSNEVLEQVILVPGEKGIYNKSTGSITKGNFSGSNHLAWRSGVLNFVNAPLPEVLESVERAYGLNIESSSNLDNYHITARYVNESPETILQSLQLIYGFQCSKDGNNIIIK